MYYISDVDYFDELSNNIYGDERSADVQELDKFVDDYGSLITGQTSNYLDGSVIQFTFGNEPKQLWFNALGGKKGNGTIESTINITNETNRNFTLQWIPEKSGYALKPAGNTNVYMVVHTKENALYGKSTSGGNDKNEEDAVFVIQNANVKDKILWVSFNVQTPKDGNYAIYVNDGGFLSPSKDVQPTEFKIKFVEMGKEGWKLLIAKNKNVGAYCCFPTSDLASYTNFTNACNEIGFTTTSDLCKGAVPGACQNLIKDGFDNPLCKGWCQTTGNEKLCYSNIKDWCIDPKNADKPVCACFNQSKFDKYKEEYYKYCPSCQVSNFSPGCYFDQCINSGMNVIAQQGEQCPSQTSIWQKCVQNLDLSNSNINAKEIALKCQLNGEPIESLTGGDTGGVVPPLPGSTTQPPPLPGSTTQPPPLPPTLPPTSEEPSFWEQYKWYIIGGGVGLVLILILVAVAFAVSKS